MSLKVCDELNFGGLSCLMDISWGKSGVVVEFYILDNGHQGKPYTHSNTSTLLRKWWNRLFTSS